MTTTASAPATNASAKASAPATDASKTSAAPFAALMTAQTLFIVEVERGKAYCKPWQLDPDARSLTTTRGALAEQVSYELAGDELTLIETERTRGGAFVASASCGWKLPLRNAPDGILADGAMWFSTEATCLRAVRDHRRVASSLDCGLSPEVSAKAVNATRAKFEHILARGGKLYSILEGYKCESVRVAPHKKREEGVLAGQFEWDVEREDRVKGRSALGYSLRRGRTAMSLTGPSTIYRDGSGHAFGCGKLETIEVRDGFVQLQEAMYVSRDACTTAARERALTDSWFPLADDEVAASDAPEHVSSALGGC